MITAFRDCINELGILPFTIYADCNTKVLGEEVNRYLLSKEFKFRAAPGEIQNQNGLVERKRK